MVGSCRDGFLEQWNWSVTFSPIYFYNNLLSIFRSDLCSQQNKATNSSSDRRLFGQRQIFRSPRNRRTVGSRLNRQIPKTTYACKDAFNSLNCGKFLVDMSPAPITRPLKSKNSFYLWRGQFTFSRNLSYRGCTTPKRQCLNLYCVHTFT